MTVELVYEPRLAEYRLTENHPLRPERFTLAVELMRAWGLFCESAERDLRGARADCAVLVGFEPATTEDLLRVHDENYLAAVKMAAANPDSWGGAFGIGGGDTPPFPHMHEVSAEIAGATIRALDDVLSGKCERAFNPAGGLHHAHRDYASGFCVYNDVAVAIAHARAADPKLTVAYVDVDAHHGDGVQAIFNRDPNVLTISLHESGRYIFPGTGRLVETGGRGGEGSALNLPLPPGATDRCYALALEGVVAPALRSFSPDVLVVQLGADTHRADPLTHLATTVEGQYHTARRLVELAEEVCGGRIVATGGGGYDCFSATPRAWACALAALLDVSPPADLPQGWRDLAIAAAQHAGEEALLPGTTFGEVVAAEVSVAEAAEWGIDVIAETERAIDSLKMDHPLLRYMA
jgi:acetoin utilization protein AcuC